MAFKSITADLTTVDQDIFTMPATLEGAAVIGVGNITAGAVDLTLKFYKAASGVTTTLMNAKSIAAKDYIKIPTPFLMEAGDKIIMKASANTSLTTFISAPESSAAGVAKGFVPKGTYSAIATYDRNDIVDDGAGGNSYISISDGNIGHTPSSSPSYWMVNALRGATGSGDVTGPGVSVNNNVVTMNGTTGKVVQDSGYGISTSGANLGVLNANNTIGGANNYDKTQTPNRGTLTTSVAADFSTKQAWAITANGSAVVIANPTSPVHGTIYDIAIIFTTSHGATFGSKFKIGDYTPSATAGQEDRISFEYDSVADLYKRRGYGKNIGA